MKIAVISDIHGNMEALDAVMEDISKKKCDKVFVLGDYAMAGPEPSASVQFFMTKLNDPSFTMIQGNTDLMIADYSNDLYEKVKLNAPIMAESLKNDVELLNVNEKEFLKNLPIQKEVEVDGHTFLLVHGSPRKNNEDILPDTPMQEVENMLVNVDAEVVLCGHTHIPCGFQTNTKKTVINVGSIGRPFFTPNINGDNTPMSCYLTITIDQDHCLYEHNFVNYNRELAANKLALRNFDGADKLAGMLINPETRHF